jgi:carbon monoxide dehydrogenase subunit G
VPFTPLSSPSANIARIWEASHTERSSATPEAVWALWSDPDRWPEWHPQIESGELEGEFAVGGKARVKLRRGGRMQLEILALEPQRLVIDETRMPGARLGHEHRLEPVGSGVEITHRLYVSGPLSGLFSLMLGRNRMRGLVVTFIERERELLE